MANFEVLTLKESDRWSQLLDLLSPSVKDFYYTPNFYTLYETHGEGKAVCFVFKDGDNLAIYPFLINSINSLGYDLNNEYFDIQGAYGYNGLVSNCSEPEFLNSFFHVFQDYCKHSNIIAEFTRFNPLLQNHLFAQNHMKIIMDRQTVFLDLNRDYHQIWTTSYSSQNRNKIRKAEKLGYRCQILSNPNKEHIDKFIDIYTANMKAVGADEFYLFNADYFYNTFRLLQNHTYLFNVIDQAGHLISGSIVILYNHTLHYHFSGRLLHTDNSANNFLLDNIVKFGKENQATLFFLGGGRSSSENDSLLKFKMNFSKTTYPFYIGHKIHNEEIYRQVIQQWEKRDPHTRQKYGNRLLKYRY